MGISPCRSVGLRGTPYARSNTPSGSHPSPASFAVRVKQTRSRNERRGKQETHDAPHQSRDKFTSSVETRASPGMGAAMSKAMSGVGTKEAPNCWFHRTLDMPSLKPLNCIVAKEGKTGFTAREPRYDKASAIGSSVHSSNIEYTSTCLGKISI